jgi:hypothetical protein
MEKKCSQKRLVDEILRILTHKLEVLDTHTHKWKKIKEKIIRIIIIDVTILFSFNFLLMCVCLHIVHILFMSR